MASSNSSENKRTIVAELVRMFAVFPVQDQSREGQKLRLETYLADLGGFPAWVVQIACVKVRRGLFPQLNRAFAPTSAELAEIVRELLVKDGKADADGTIKFEGEAPVTWVPSHDPRWSELCRMAKAETPKAKPYAMTSKYAPGLGRFFNTAHVDAMPLTDAEREAMNRPPRDVHKVIASVASGMDALRAELRPAGTLPKASVKELAAAALNARLKALGHDPAALDAIPDAPARKVG